MKQEQKIVKNSLDDSVEPADDKALTSPGRMLKDARESKGLSQQDVADKLNFRVRLVQEIEADKFDQSLPEAFNRGYLKNYAKLVDISQEETINCYEQLGGAQGQCSGMQSFSKGTEKQAEHNLLMWISYLIVAILVTATVVWWLQTPSEQPEPIAIEQLEQAESDSNTIEKTRLSSENSTDTLTRKQNLESAAPLIETSVTSASNIADDNLEALATRNVEINSSTSEQTTSPITADKTVLKTVDAISEGELNTSTTNVVFTFSGDCWVNIFDATGERIAWGVKKSGYIMHISGQAPFSITLGKPELVAIQYNNVAVDMATFNAGNIAKFSLPLVP